jgi:hypothetical protein
VGVSVTVVVPNILGKQSSYIYLSIGEALPRVNSVTD